MTNTNTLFLVVQSGSLVLFYMIDIEQHMLLLLSSNKISVLLIRIISYKCFNDTQIYVNTEYFTLSIYYTSLKSYFRVDLSISVKIVIHIMYNYYNTGHTSCMTKELSSSSPGHSTESIL